MITNGAPPSRHSERRCKFLRDLLKIDTQRHTTVMLKLRPRGFEEPVPSSGSSEEYIVLLEQILDFFGEQPFSNIRQKLYHRFRPMFQARWADQVVSATAKLRLVSRHVFSANSFSNHSAFLGDRSLKEAWLTWLSTDSSLSPVRRQIFGALMRLKSDSQQHSVYHDLSVGPTARSQLVGRAPSRRKKGLDYPARRMA